MLNTPLDPQERDFLEMGRGGGDPSIPVDEPSNRLLKEILWELRRSHAGIRCVVDVQYSNPAGLLTGPLDRADVRFLYNGKPVKAQRILVGQSVNRGLNVAVNEPSVIEPTGTRGNGLWLLANTSNPQYLELNAEVEWISIGLITNTTTNVISVGKAPPTGITPGTTGGLIPVYAWTVPQADMMEQE